jgi:hypothetical protein
LEPKDTFREEKYPLLQKYSEVPCIAVFNLDQKIASTPKFAPGATSTAA